MSDAVIKKTLFERIASALRNMFRFKNNVDGISLKVYSKFRDHLSGLDENDPMYEHAYLAADFCEAALQTAKQRLVLVDRIKNLQVRIDELEAYLKLTDEEANRLKNLLNSFVSLTKERNDLIYRLTGFDKSLPRLENLLQDANNAMPEIQHAEKSHKMLRQDIGYLQGEREDLIFEREKIEKGLTFIEKFRVWATVAFFVGMLSLTFLFVINEVNIFVPAAFLMILIIVTIPLLYLFRRRMRYELKMNIAKQRKAVSMINTKTTVFAHYTNYLNYSYRKYKVRNSQALKSNLKDYENFKHITQRIDALRRTMYVTENEITKFLREHSISNKFTVEQFAHTVNISDKLDFSHELVAERAVLDRDLALLDDKHQDIWDKLEVLIDTDTTDDRVISQLTQIYFDEVDKIVDDIE
ncbi:MAG: hypothetical protein FWE20_03535 [Defluviitaleaceae bacterium]|nr:hypothetical protein [Defluviitaleaceae bacterium]